MTRRSVFILLIAVLAHNSVQAAKVTPMTMTERKAVMNLPGMCSIRPAGRWDGGIVTGNGVMGATVLGQPYQEKVIFNHERLFRPFLNERPLPPKIASALPEVRRMMRAGKGSQALAYWREVMAENGHPKIINTPPYHPAYTMHIERDDDGDVSDYLRTVDFMTGEAVVRFRNGGGRWINKTFVSRKDNVIVQLFESQDNKPISLDLRLVDQWHGFNDSMAGIKTTISTKWMSAGCKYHKTARGYEGTTRIICEGGRVQVDGDVVRCENTKRVLLLTRIVSLEDSKESDISGLQQDLAKLPTAYDLLLKRHVKLHRTAMERMTLTLDQSDDLYLSSEEWIKKQSESPKIIPAFLQKMFNMGRYASLSSSGGYPAPLTGIWNGSHKPAWSGDWTLDTNLNQQIAGANTCALIEAIMAYLGLIAEIAPSWELNAQNIYGARGHMAGFRTAGRENYHTHFSKFPGHCWTAGATWLVYPLYEYYLVTGDKDFLKQHVLPLMENSVFFFEDFLTEYDEDGKFMFVPSYSPEHVSSNCINAAQDIAAAKQAVRTLIEAYEDLGIKPDRVKDLKVMLKKFPPYLVNEEGAFKEWAHPRFGEHYDHRHMSHSYPVWPAHELNWEEHPELVQAMRVAIERRLPQEWSAHGFAVRAFCAARTKYPSLWYQNIYTLMSCDYIQDNLISRHNPGWCPNTDWLCGLPGMISEATVYSKPGVIELLPAWSAEIPIGSIEGTRCRTQATVSSLAWDLHKKVVKVTITSRKDQWITLYMRQGIKKLNANTTVKLSEHGRIARKIYLKKDQPVNLTIVLDKAVNDYPVNKPAFTYEDVKRVHAERMAKRKSK